MPGDEKTKAPEATGSHGRPSTRDKAVMAIRSLREDGLLFEKTKTDPAGDPMGSEFATSTIDPPRRRDATRWLDDLRVQDAASFSYTVGILGAAAFMGLAIGPGWLGFLVAFLPASALSAWEASLHD